MPCYTIRKTEVAIDRMRLDILMEGLRAAGFSVRENGETLIFSEAGSYLYHVYENGKLSLQTSATNTSTASQVERLTSAVKQAYSSQVVRFAANKMGWKLNEKKTAQAQEFTAQRRR